MTEQAIMDEGEGWEPRAAMECEPLEGGGRLYRGELPRDLVPDAAQMEELWALHPEEYHEIMMHGRKVRTPRWQQAYGEDYRYTGNVNEALELTAVMQDLLAWSQEAIDARLNGLLFNWYEGELGHYIGAHRDSTQGLVRGAPIVTLSLGEERVFRMRPWKGKGYEDFAVPHGSVLVIPWSVNARYTHEVPYFTRYTGRRISITFRGFVGS